MTPIDYWTTGYPVFQYLRVCSDSCPLRRWCHTTISSSVTPFFLLPSIFPSIRVFSNESTFHIWWPKDWSFNFGISPSNEYSGLISFRIDWFSLLLSKGLSRNFSSTTIQKHELFDYQLSLWPNSTYVVIALPIQTFVDKVMPLIFYRKSRFVIAFLPKSKNHLIPCWVTLLIDFGFHK